MIARENLAHAPLSRLASGYILLGLLGKRAVNKDTFMKDSPTR
jgi:hypothetical protein